MPHERWKCTVFVMAAPVTLSAARKLVDPHGVLWADGPVCGPGEAKAWDMDLADLLELVETVEHVAPDTATAAQWLRRMFYSRPLGGAGGGFDTFIATDRRRAAFPMTVRDIPQSVLDALVRVGSIRVPGAAPPFDKVEVSHVFVLLDLRMNGPSPQGRQFDDFAPDITLADILSYAGDMASAWTAYQDRYEVARRAAGSIWSEPTATAADLATPLAWLEIGIRGRAAIDDLLGDMDAVVIADRPLPAGPSPIAQALKNYYTVGVSSDFASARVDDRFPQWVTRTRKAIPFEDVGGVIRLTADARPWAEDQIYWGTFALLARHRNYLALSKPRLALAANSLDNELKQPWHAAMRRELADRFITFVEDGLAGRAVSWPTGVVRTVPYPGYDWSPSPPFPPASVPMLDDIEAIAQFHLNWKQSHLDLRADPKFTPLRLRDPAGEGATIAAGGGGGSTRIQLGGHVRLGDVVHAPTGEHADLLWLEGDTARASRTYRIVAVDRADRLVTVEGVPNLAAPSAWRVVRRPRLVLFDPFGARMAGAMAQGMFPDGWIVLDGAPDFDRIRANFDVVLLWDDIDRPSRAYRIVEVHPTEPRVRLDDVPNLPVDSRWQIPGGVAWVVNPLALALAPSSQGCDAYDGLLFVVHQDAVNGQPVPFSSYASAVNAPDPVFGSSITGNAQYVVRSLRSPDSSARNYEFAVTDPDKIAADAVSAAAFFGSGVTALRQPPGPLSRYEAPLDSDGKTAIRIHIGNATGSISGSTGDLVSPEFPSLRTQLISLHQAERALLGLPPDPDLATVAAATTQAQSVGLYEAGAIGNQQWNDRIRAELILLRPDLRPTAP